VAQRRATLSVLPPLTTGSKNGRLQSPSTGRKRQKRVCRQGPTRQIQMDTRHRLGLRAVSVPGLAACLRGSGTLTHQQATYTRRQRTSRHFLRDSDVSVRRVVSRRARAAAAPQGGQRQWVVSVPVAVDSAPPPWGPARAR
jgi:hypothetical protein